jgi:hypothetical protein
MTTLKTYHADEIAAALAAQLKDDSFIGLYRKAEDTWWMKGPASGSFKKEMDAAKTQPEAVAIHNKWLAAGSEGATALGKEHDDFTPMIEYSEDRQQQLASGQPAPKVPIVPPQQPMKAEDGGCEEHTEAEDGCAACADAGALAIAIDFTIKHMVKVADALDKVGFANVASLLDETLQKLASARPIVVEAKKGKKDEKKEDKKGKKDEKKEDKKDKKDEKKEDKKDKKGKEDEDKKDSKKPFPPKRK